MQEKRVLITGASGLLGGNLIKLLPKTWGITGIVHEHSIISPSFHIGIQRMNLLTENIETLISSCCPLDAVIHTAALTNVDLCEMEKRMSWHLNALLTRDLAQACAKHNIHFVHISTDHVFDGKSGDYTEGDFPHPVNYYAETKRAAEEFVEEVGGISTIIRTNFFGYAVQHKRGIAGWILQTLKRHEPLTLFPDVHFSPILVNSLVPCIAELIERKLTGLFHLAASDSCSKEEFGRKLAAAFGLQTESIVSLPLAKSQLPVPRPRNMSLNTSKAQALLTSPLPTVDESIAAYRQLQESNYPQELRSLLATF